MENCRVCILSSSHPTFDPRIFHKEARGLADAGYEVHFYTYHEETTTEEGIQIHGFDKPKNKKQRVSLALKLVWEASKKNFDVYHFHDPELLPGGLILDLITDGKVVYDIHENYEETFSERPWIPSALQSFVGSVFDKLEHVVSYRFDGVIAASPDISERFTHHKTVETVTNYPFTDWARETEERQPTKDDSTVQIIYCGGLSRNRKILEIIDAVKELSGSTQVRLVLGGFYPDPTIEERIKSAQKDMENLELIGWVDTVDKMIDHFRESDVGVILFDPESQNMVRGAHRSNKLFQYMSAGIPVVAPEIAEWAEIIEENYCGIPVNPLDQDNLVEAFEYLIQNPEERERMGENGRKAVLETYNWENEEKKLFEFYRKLIQ